jgi:RNA polymerase-binding transcription factor
VTETPSLLNAMLVEEFGRRLREARHALLRTLATTDAEIATLGRHEPGAVVEDAARDTTAAILSRLEGREKHELDDIEDALVRLEAGTFGLCERCGRAIQLARLRALPATRYCFNCQQKAETTR